MTGVYCGFSYHRVCVGWCWGGVVLEGMSLCKVIQQWAVLLLFVGCLGMSKAGCCGELGRG